MRARGLLSLGPISALILTIAAIDARAQTYQGSLRGTVRDATGVVPGVEVVLFNEESHAVRASTTNGVGEYGFPNLLPGAYTLKAALAGFKTFESRGIRIGTQDALVLDVLLEVGDVREVVIVTGAPPTIEKATAAVSTVLDRASLESLPNPGPAGRLRALRFDAQGLVQDRGGRKRAAIKNQESRIKN